MTTPEEIDAVLNRCVVHTQHWDDDCEMCVSSRDEVTAAIQKMITGNHQAMKTLAAEGAQVDPHSLVSARLEQLIAMLLNGKQRAVLDYRFHSQVAANLEQMRSQVNRAKLTSPLIQPTGRTTPKKPRPR
jgi:hypothetical protein